jgi:ribosomal protein L10
VEEPGDAADASLGELAIAFKQAEDPQDAAKILVEFMVEAGFKRE